MATDDLDVNTTRCDQQLILGLIAASTLQAL
jgi:hypothetical protein